MASGIILIPLFNHYRSLQQGQEIISGADPEVDIAIGKVHQVSTRDGRKEWVLDAESAKMMGSENRLGLEKITAVFYSEDGQQVHLSADRGSVDTRTNDVEVTGNVVLNNEEYKLTSDKISYHKSSQLITSPGQVRITGGKSDLKADNMTFNLNSKNARMEGNVVGIFSDQKLF